MIQAYFHKKSEPGTPYEIHKEFDGPVCLSEKEAFAIFSKTNIEDYEGSFLIGEDDILSPDGKQLPLLHVGPGFTSSFHCPEVMDSRLLAIVSSLAEEYDLRLEEKQNLLLLANRIFAFLLSLEEKTAFGIDVLNCSKKEQKVIAALLKRAFAHTQIILFVNKDSETLFSMEEKTAWALDKEIIEALYADFLDMGSPDVGNLLGSKEKPSLEVEKDIMDAFQTAKKKKEETALAASEEEKSLEEKEADPQERIAFRKDCRINFLFTGIFLALSSISAFIPLWFKNDSMFFLIASSVMTYIFSLLSCMPFGYMVMDYRKWKNEKPIYLILCFVILAPLALGVAVAIGILGRNSEIAKTVALPSAIGVALFLPLWGIRYLLVRIIKPRKK